jgi:hypothetical protein
MLTTTSHPFNNSPVATGYSRDILPDDDAGLVAAPLLSPTITSLFGSVKHAGRVSVPARLQLKVAFAELKLDLREALFPDKHIYVVAESLCASVEVLLPEGVTVVDHGASIFSSQRISQAGEEHGPVIYVDGWSVCSDVKFVSA